MAAFWTVSASRRFVIRLHWMFLAATHASPDPRPHLTGAGRRQGVDHETCRPRSVLQSVIVGDQFVWPLQGEGQDVKIDG